jgi:hypothetical protein
MPTPVLSKSPLKVRHSHLRQISMPHLLPKIHLHRHWRRSSGGGEGGGVINGSGDKYGRGLHRGKCREWGARKVTLEDK